MRSDGGRHFQPPGGLVFEPPVGTASASERIEWTEKKREKAKLSSPDLTERVDLSTVPDGTMLLGHVRGEPVLLARRSDELLRSNRGLLVGDTVRCPWHCACFSLRTGEALRAPAPDPVSRWQVEEMHDLARQSTPVETRPGVVYVREKLESADRQPRPMPAGAPGSVTIVGGGAAGNAAAVVERIRL